MGLYGLALLPSFTIIIYPSTRKQTLSMYSPGQIDDFDIEFLEDDFPHPKAASAKDVHDNIAHCRAKIQMMDASVAWRSSSLVVFSMVVSSTEA